MPDDFCLIHGCEHMRSVMGNPVAYCAACEAERTHEGPLVDDAFYCVRCGQPINRNSDGSDKPNSGGMCSFCASTGTVIA